MFSGPASKTCSRCLFVKPLTEFSAQPRGLHGRTAACKSCARVVSREYGRRCPDKTANKKLRLRFGIDLATYDRMLALQGGVCAICGRPPVSPASDRDVTRLSVDHRHVEGFADMAPEEKQKHVRGLVHHNCNLLLGNAKEDPAVLIGAAEYLARWSDV